MASKLDQMLQPGERVVWRTRWNWVPYLWPLAVLALGGFGYLLVFSQHEKRVVGAIILGLLLSVWLFNAFTRWQTAALVTDRRELYRGSYGRSAVVEVALGEIERIEGPEVVRVHLRYGRRVTFDDIRRTWPFARALAQAARLPSARWVGALGVVDLLFQAGGWGLAVGPLGQLVAAWTGREGAAPVSWESLLLLALALCLIVPSMGRWLPGLYLLRGLALIVLRPVLGAAQARDWLCQEAGSPRGRWTQRHLLPLLLKWAGLLYGEAMQIPKEGAEANGL